MSRSSRLRAEPTNPRRAGRASARPRTRAVRAAASSSASGMPSRRRHSAATLSMSSMTAPARSARSQNMRTASESRCAASGAEGSGSRSGATTRTSSPVTPSASRLVARTRTSGASRTTRPTTSAVASRTCSQLSTTRRSERGSSASTRRSQSETPWRGDTPNVSRNARGDGGRFDHPAQVDEPALAARLPGELDREPRLADPAGPRERHEPRARDGVGQPFEVVVPPEERVGRLGMFVANCAGSGRADGDDRDSTVARNR